MTIYADIFTGSGGTLPPTVPTTFTENSGTAAPALNNINILGSPSISTSGSGSTVTISSTGSAPLVPSVVSIYDDFLQGDIQDFNYLIQGVVGDANASAVNNGSDANHPGILTMNSGTFAMTAGIIYSQTDSAFLVPNVAGFKLGGGAFDINFIVKIPTLSTGTNRFTVAFGITDWDAGAVTITANPQNGCYFNYVDNANSGNWQAFTYSGGVATTLNSTIAADTGWHRFRITINAAGTSVGFSIDGVPITGSPSVTNIPTTAIGPTILITAGAGTGGNLYVDMYNLLYTLTTPRY